MNRIICYTKGIATSAILIATAALTTTVVAQPVLFSDFDDGRLDGEISLGSKLIFARELEGNLELRANFRDPTNGDPNNSLGGVVWERDLSLDEGESVELRVEVIEKSPNTIVGVTTWSAADNGLYGLLVGQGRVALAKLVSFTQEARFFEEPFEQFEGGVTLSLIRTRAGENVLLRALIVDSGNGQTLFDKTFADTPDSDPSVNSELDIRNRIADPVGRPFVSGSHGQILIMQITDGNEGPVFGKFDNFTSEVRGPMIHGIRKAVQITWPKYETDFILEGAPSVDGPWGPVFEPINSDGAMNSVTVPVGAGSEGGLEVFRLVEP